MKRAAWIVVLLVLASCSGSEDPIYKLSRDPVSVRGWINDVKGAKPGETMEMEVARRTEMFVATSVWAEGNEYASGGIAENGAFVVLDVQPGKSVLGFNAPGAENARIVLEGIPGSADVIIPEVILEPNGATVVDPSRIVIRVPSDVSQRTPTGQTAKVNQYTVPIVNVPLAEMSDRRDYPKPSGFQPVATYK